MKKHVAALAVAAGLGVSVAYADDSTYDPRAMAMGGTGVTTSSTRNAAFQDPAMLASGPRDSFALEFPVVSARVQDQGHLQSNVSQLKTSASNLSAAVQVFQAAPTAANATAAASALSNFNNSMMAADNKSLMLDVFAGTMLGLSGKSNGYALFLDARAEVGGMFNYAAADNATITALAANLATCAGGGAGAAAACLNAQGGIGANGQITNLQSTLQVRSVLIKEVGISAAHHFDSLGGVDIGITPKAQQVNTYDYAIGAQQGTSLSLNLGNKNYSAANVDIGAVKAFKRGDGNEFRAGVVVKNMMSKSFTTVLGDHIDIKPQATVGASYVTKLTTTGIDVDAIPNKPIINGFSKESQYLRLGAEFDAWRWAQVRIGWRHDLKKNYPNLPSFGLGLSPFGLHVDLSVAYAGHREGAASLQTGFNF